MARHSTAMRVRGLLVAGVIGGAIVLTGALPAAAGGSWFDPVHDSYEPGETVTLVGYTGGGSQGWVEDGPFHGFLRASDPAGTIPAGPPLDVGTLTLEHTGQGGYLALRASITFTLPEDLSAGTYQFDYCNEGCHEKLGDLVGGVLHVGVDPPHPVGREWPLDDPEVANLEPDAVLTGPGFRVTAADVRAGRVPPAGGALGQGPPSPLDTAVPSTSTTGVPPTTTVPAADLDDAHLAVSAPTTTPGAGSSATPWLVAGAALLSVSGAGAVGRRRRGHLSPSSRGGP
jgi:hypothetical protein